MAARDVLTLGGRSPTAAQTSKCGGKVTFTNTTGKGGSAPERDIPTWKSMNLGFRYALQPRPSSPAHVCLLQEAPAITLFWEWSFWLSTQLAAATREFLTGWAEKVHAEISPQAMYLFGSLIYRDGALFNNSSDVDLIVVMPEIPDAADRADWIESLMRYKVDLEDELGKHLRRSDRSAIICSVVAVTSVEVSANLHKDGAATFFSNNRFLDLLTGETINGLADAGKRPILERLVGECLRYAQKTRNAYLGVNAFGDCTLGSFDDKSDSAPKQAMRHAAMIQFLEDDGDGDPGAEFDLDIGADKLTILLHDRRKRLAYLHALYAARRGGRAARDALSSKDQLILAELIYDAAFHVEVENTVVSPIFKDLAKAYQFANVIPDNPSSAAGGPSSIRVKMKDILADGLLRIAQEARLDRKTLLNVGDDGSIVALMQLIASKPRPGDALLIAEAVKTNVPAHADYRAMDAIKAVVDWGASNEERRQLLMALDQIKVRLGPDHESAVRHVRAKIQKVS